MADKKRVLIILVAAGAAFVSSFSYTLIKAKLHKQDYVVETALAFNRNSGNMIDEQTRFRQAVAGPGHSLTLVHTVLGVNREEIIPEELIPYVEPGLREYVRTNPSPMMDDLRRHNVTLVYVYETEAQEEIFRLTYTPEDYR